MSDMWTRAAQGYVNHGRHMWSAGVVPRGLWTGDGEERARYETATRAYGTLPSRACLFDERRARTSFCVFCDHAFDEEGRQEGLK